MSFRTLLGRSLASIAGVFLLAGSLAVAEAKEVLISDRTTNSVFRYDESGNFIAPLLTDNVNLNGPSGLQVSPDGTKLYVASSGNNQVVQYDYNYAAGTATNATVFADGADGLSFPNSVKFSPSGDKVYVSNLGGSGVAQFNPNGSSAGAPINGLVGGGAFFQFSGLDFAPNGDLLVGAFQDFPAGANGAVARSNAAITSISDFIGASPSLNGVGNLLVVGNDLYVTGGFAGTVSRYNATTGALDNTFSINGLIFPASLSLSPDGNSLLVGVLGFANGTGQIAQYNFDGTPVGDGIWAAAQNSISLGFSEATGIVVVVPEPSSLVLVGVAIASLGLAARRRVAKRRI
jgi:DNA-binding beta-propeller fold protein YncE